MALGFLVYLNVVVALVNSAFNRLGPYASSPETRRFFPSSDREHRQPTHRGMARLS